MPEFKINLPDMYTEGQIRRALEITFDGCTSTLKNDSRLESSLVDLIHQHYRTPIIERTMHILKDRGSL